MTESGKKISLSNNIDLGILESGDPDGYPVIHHHGHGNSRLEGKLFHNAATEAEIRLITIDRPGYGLSTLQDYDPLWMGRRTGELIDYLEINNCSVIGISAGSCYALSTHYMLGKSVVENTASISTVGPPGVGNHTLPRSIRFAQFSSRRITWLYKLMLKKQLDIQSDRQKIMNFAKKRQTSFPPEDYRLMTDPEFIEMYVEIVNEAIRHGVMGTIRDIQAFSSDWGFSLANIPNADNITLWHGTEDRGYEQVQLIADMNTFNTRFIEGEGHVSVATNHIHEIFSSIKPR